MSLKPRKVDFKLTWASLLKTVKGVITCSQVERATWNDRFSDVYALCVAYPDPFGEELYKETKTFLEGHVEHLFEQVKKDEDILSAYNLHWDQYCRGSSYLNQLYGYMNTQYIKKQKYSDADINYGGFCIDFSDSLMEIGELALDIWKRLMIDRLKSQLIDLLLEEIYKDRCGGTVNQSVLHGVINSFVNVEQYKSKNPLQMYIQIFEQPFLEETGRYYKQEANSLLQDYNCSEYMEKVIQRLDEEDFRSRKFLHPSSYSKVTKECQYRMVADHLQTLQAECKDMVKKEKRQDLSHMYRLLQPLPCGLQELVNEFQEHIKQTALGVVQGLKGDNIPAQFVESLLDVHTKYTEMTQCVFSSDQHFIGALDKACAAAINYRPTLKQPCKSPELVAKYCDTLVKKSAKGMSEVEVDDKLASSITIFKYLDDKDIFQRFYARMLARRLIYGQSTSMDAEEAMINRLKQACGYEYTSKLHRMFTDMTISSDLNGKFHEYVKGASQDLGVNFSILVLQAGAWPISVSNQPTFSIPSELEKSVKKFEAFYNSSFSGRKLTWLHSFCSAELKMSYLKKTFFVTMGTFQMACLLLFNNADVLNFQEIRATTNLPEKELCKQLQTLVDAKLLISQSPVSTQNSFQLNLSYNNKRTKFKITAAVQKEPSQEVEQQHNAIDEDRKMFLQAAIVRIMKARKILKHNLLIQEVISQSRARFAPSISMIKKCIESLIDKQYLERTPNTTDEYSYVA